MFSQSYNSRNVNQKNINGLLLMLIMITKFLLLTDDVNDPVDAVLVTCASLRPNM